MSEPEPYGPRLLLVDGHAYAYRSFHAIRGLTSPSGAPTNAIYGFIQSLNRLLESVRPSLVAIVWDGGLAAERLALLPAYKAHRPEMPPGLRQQLDPMVGWLDAMGLASLRRDEIEADDWIATLATQADQQRIATVIASSDKDFLQLVSGGIGILSPSDKSGCVLTAEGVQARTGVRPDQIVDWLSMVGDSVDNIPGIAGVGTKTAAQLLQQFGSWEGVLAGAVGLRSERLREALVHSVELVQRNREMIRLRCNLELGVLPEDCRCREPDTGRLRAMYAGWGFRRWLAELGPEPGKPKGADGFLPGLGG